jgi:hypothetical protein
VSAISTSGLSTGSFYMISDFKTCYDQPDFDIENNPITTGNTKQGVVEPIIVFATSISTISMDAYQPLYPNDKIKYDWTFSATEVTNSVAYGRITERIDEFNNRTDYDHRTILFKRYRLYTHREGLRLNGTTELLNDGTINGVNTSFTALTVGNIINIPNATPNYYEIVTITDNLTMTVSGDTIGSTGTGSAFYLAVEEITNDDEYGGYFSYKRTNVKTDDFIEYTTFGDAIDESYAKNNYVGNYANNYTNISDGTFILANNVFIQGQYESNKFGDYCYNNTFGTDNQNNTWGDWCYENVSTNDIDTCIIGHYFYRNLINLNLDNNQIGNNFYDNRLLTENNTDFANNKIGNYFNNNTLYSGFYENTIDNYFQNNTIGDFGNLNNFNFNRNIIGNYFDGNIIRQSFQNNQIANNFNYNITNGYFGENVIGLDFNNNQNIGDNFNSNNIGEMFANNELIGDYFQDNNIGNYFDNNGVSYFFKNNQIKNSFTNNTLGNSQYFNWDNTDFENLNGRTYNTFYSSLYGDGGEKIGHVILGKELIMHDTVNDEYHKVKFTQWTQNGNGSGFSYERTKVHPTIEPTVYFTKRNYGSEVDVIVPGSLEIKRGNNGAIYNSADESNWNTNQSPVGTEWNSIYTQSSEINGAGFENNKIDDDFKGNYILSDFYINNINSFVLSNEFSGSTSSNNMGAYTLDNNFKGGVFGNSWVGGFYGNNISDGFYANNFYDSISNSTIGENFKHNVVNTDINSVDFTLNLGNITGFTYTALGSTATDNIYLGLGGTTNGNGIGATFNVEVSGNTVIGVSGNTEGNLYMCGNTITMLGSLIGGTDSVDDVVVTVSGISTKPSVYETYNCAIFERKGGEKRLSFYDENDVLTITNINQ